ATRPDMTDSPPLPTMDYYDSQAVNQYIADRTKEGFLVCCNHPYWSLNTYAEYSKLKGCFAMEIYNHNCEVDDGCCGYAPQVYDDMLRLENKLFCFAADDNHNYGPSHLPDKDSFGGFININSSSLKYEDVITALIDGNFYASQGSEIYEISLEDSALTVQCSPAQSVRVYTQGRKCYEQTGNGLTKATFQLSGDEGYIRIVCRDKDHKVANSNAYWI
ncbi:MAG: PHP domain-containing protein, partial [Defluviitaleaceae bacterium]|nr:PHP domain-containing protein [Defluviitaleaceae bacterium]